MKKLRKHINKYKKTSIWISIFLIMFSFLLIYIEYYNTQKIYKSIKTIDINELIKKEDEKFIQKINSYDLKTDDSLTKFVNNKISFDNLKYIPNDLQLINGEYIIDTKWVWQLRQEANKALQNLSKDFFIEFWKKLIIISSYRSYEYQVWIKNRWCPDNLCAKAWFSEHQTWLAVDIFAATTNKDWKTNPEYIKYYNWFKLNAYKYWFHNTYQKWLEIDWYEIEPWHWRYLWKDLAKYLLENDMTFAEYYKEKE